MNTINSVGIVQRMREGTGVDGRTSSKGSLALILISSTRVRVSALVEVGFVGRPSSDAVCSGQHPSGMDEDTTAIYGPVGTTQGY